MNQPRCLKEYGWEKKSGGKGCQRRKPSDSEYKSSASLEMPSNPGLTLKEHQTRIAEKLKKQKGLIVQHGLGSGKTLTAINAAEDYGGAIVVTPASLQDNFKKELGTYGAKGKYDVYSYEKFLRDKPDTTGRMLIVDEAHRIRNSATKGYKAIAEGAEGAEKVLLLTATPVQNKPHELAPLVNIAADKKVLPLSENEFRSKYIQRKGIPFWQRPFVPANTYSIDKPKNLQEFNRNVSKYVDQYTPLKEGYPSVAENTIEVPMTKSQIQSYQFFAEKLDPITKYKMQKNLPLDKKESSNLNAFINAQRQVANTEKAFDTTAKGKSPKTMEIATRIQGGEGKALVYSNFLDSGIKDLSSELGDRRISHRVYTGQLTRKEKDQIIADYNNEKFKVLIVSSAGGEGLDLKRTRQVHIMEPHWNEEKIAQVMGRAIRYKSHDGLPPEKQNVETYQYISVFPKNVFGMKSGKVTADQYLTELGRKKKTLNDQFLSAIKSDSLRFDKKCGTGWEGVKGKCKRAKPTEKPKPTMKEGLTSLALVMGVAGMAATTYALLSSFDDPAESWKTKKGYEIAYEVAKRSFVVNGVSPAKKEDLSTVAYPANYDDYTKLGQGQLSKVSLDPTKTKVLKEQLEDPADPLYIYSAAYETLASDIAKSSGIPSVETSMISAEDVSRAKGRKSKGAVLQTLAKGKPLVSFEEGKPFKEEVDMDDVYAVLSEGAEEFDMRIVDKGDSDQRRSMATFFSHPDLAKIAAFDTFTGNRDRHYGNLFFDKETGSFTAIDNGLAFSSTEGTDSLLRTLSKTEKVPSSWNKEYLETYRQTLSSLVEKNNAMSVKRKLFGYIQLDDGTNLAKDLYRKTENLSTIDKNIAATKKIIKEIERLQGIKTDSLRFDKKCGTGWEGVKGKCKRAKQKTKNESDKKTRLVIGAAIGITGLALTGAVMVGRNLYEVDRKQPQARTKPSPSAPVDTPIERTQEDLPVPAPRKRSGDIVSRKGISEAFDWAIDNGTPLTHVEKAAIDHYRGNGYREINNRLRGRAIDNPYLTEESKSRLGKVTDVHISNLDEALDRLPLFTGEHVPIGETFRAEGNDYVDYPVMGRADKLIRVTKTNREKILSLYQKGNVIKEAGYLSTATFLSKGKMDDFATNGNPHSDATVVYEIHWKKEGTAARWVTESTHSLRDENEVLFKRGTSFRVADVKESDYKLRTEYGYKVILEEV